MNGMKTCCEVFQLMNGSEMISQLQDGTSLVEGCSKVDGNENVVSIFYLSCKMQWILISNSFYFVNFHLVFG